jgi:lipopolysaccharide/colanic/teichoic acid biosynthesis glycosyltransferase
MLGHHVRLTIILADIVAVPLALFLAYLLRYGGQVGTGLIWPTPWAPLVVVLAALGAWLGLYELMPLDCFREGWHLSAAVSRIVLATAIQLGVVLAMAYLAKWYYSRLLLAYFAILFCALVLLIRALAYSVLRMRRRAGKARRVVVIGEGRVARELVHRMRRHPELLFEVMGLLNPWIQSGDHRGGDSANSSGELSSLDALKLLEQKGVVELIVCLDHPAVLELQNFLIRCGEQGIHVSLVPQPYELYSSRAKLLEVEGVPLISLEGPPDFRVLVAIKRATDLILGLPLVVLALPVLAISSLALKFQGHRLLRRELRGGQHGEPFWMYRLDVDRHAPDAPAVQRLMCRFSISELPQLFNVLSGQMSLVGPRPESLERVQDYSEWQRQRLKVKPGMTGLAQVNGLREQHSSEEKTRYDLQYTIHWTPIIDLVLLLETVWALTARLWASTEPRLAPSSKGDKHTSVFPRSAAEQEVG